MQSVLHRRLWQFFASWGQTYCPHLSWVLLALPSLNLTLPLGGLWLEGFMEELKLLVSLCYRKRCLFWLMTQPWPLLSDVSSHLRQPSTFGCGLRFRSEPLDIGRESFAPISCLALKELTLTLFTVAHDTTHGNKEEMLGNMRLDQCSPKCSFLAKRCSKSWPTYQAHNWRGSKGHGQGKESSLFSPWGLIFKWNLCR